MEFHVVRSRSGVPSRGKNAVYLRINNWNDYSFVTLFQISAFDEHGEHHELPDVKIGFIGQTDETYTYDAMEGDFSALPKGFFSLGTKVEYYQKLREDFSDDWRSSYLQGLQDVVNSPELLKQAEGEKVFQTAFLRSRNIKDVKDQFVSVLRGEVRLTDFNFGFELPASDEFAGFDLEFEVHANSIPSTNMHALIGQNGVGKTTLLNNMVRAIAPGVETDAKFYDGSSIFDKKTIGDDYFSSLISIAFSAFDPFDLPPEADGKKLETPYFYIGLTSYERSGVASIKPKGELYKEFVANLEYCLVDNGRKRRWLQAMSVLESDRNFAGLDLQELAELGDDELADHALSKIDGMSSGHTIVILTLTSLVAKVEEKTLVLFDEPETHLHPPLLSALMRSLSQLLHSRNAIAIIATHSPVVLQEIPSSCVWKVYRENLASDQKRPDIETFGENVGTLTREVFKLEVARSGFHTVLEDLVKNPKTDETYYTYDEIVDQLGGKLGLEARGVLKAMVVNRDEGTDLL